MTPTNVPADQQNPLAENEVSHIKSTALPQKPAKRKRSALIASIPPELAEKRWILPEEWAAVCAISKRQVFRLLSGGQIPPYDYQLGQKRGWKQSTLTRWLDAVQVSSQTSNR